MTVKRSKDVPTNPRNLDDVTEITLPKEAQEPDTIEKKSFSIIEETISLARRAQEFVDDTIEPQLSDITVDDLKVLIGEVVAAELQKWSNQSTITVEPESKDLDNSVSKKLYMVFQEIIDSIESLPIEDQDYLFELIRKRRIENRRAEILVNAQEVRQSFLEGKAKRGSVDDLIADLLGDDDGSYLE